jgi:hypothetical protein
MMKNFTSKKVLALIIGLFALVTVNAQQTVTKTVAATEGDYTTVFLALQAICRETATPVLVAGDNIVLNVKGDVAEPGSKFFTATGTGNIVVRGLGLNILVQGTSPNESFLTGTYPGTDNKWLQCNDATLGGTTITFKNLTFRNYGSLTTNSAANGTVVSMSTAITNGKIVKFVFENVVFTGMAGRAIVNMPVANYDVEFKNCLFKDNIFIAAGNPMASIITKSTGGNIEVKNCTFYSNIFKPLTTANQPGAILSISVGAGQNCKLVFEDNVAVNNQFEDAAFKEAVQGMVNFNTNIAPGTIDFSIKNNLFVGNRRAGTNLDVDFYFPALTATPVVADNNIVNEAIQRLGDGTTVPPYTYPRITTTGFDISPEYTYTSPKVNLEMDGVLPKLINDAFGIGHVKKLATYAPVMGEGQWRVYQSHNMDIQIDGQVSKAAVATLYDLQGRVVKVQQLKEGSQNAINASNLKPAEYLLKVKDNNRQQTIKLLTGN